jgi:hypothetical protein
MSKLRQHGEGSARWFPSCSDAAGCGLRLLAAVVRLTGTWRSLLNGRSLDR